MKFVTPAPLLLEEVEPKEATPEMHEQV